MHEFVASAGQLKARARISAMDIAKRLLDYGFHAPTVYFPLVVPEAIMIEPTETESKETLDAFADTLRCIVRESHEQLHDAPITTPISLPDEVRRPAAGAHVEAARMNCECRLLRHEPAAGAWNMAVDEVLLDRVQEHAAPCLLIYGWIEPTLSLGYFQTYSDRRQHAASRHCAAVRRLTGGGAILHDNEITYSIVLPRDHSLAGHSNCIRRCTAA